MDEQAANARTDRDDPEHEAEEGIDLERIREGVGFVLGAARRRLKLVVFTFVAIAGTGLTVSLTMPRWYYTEVKLLAQRSTIPDIIGSIPQMQTDPLKNVGVSVTRRDNVLALVKEANLQKRVQETRPAALRFKDRIMGSLFGPIPETEQQRILALKLEKTIYVTNDDSNLTIGVEWSNPQITYDLVMLVEKNFLEARYDSEVKDVTDSIALLEEHAKGRLAKVDEELESYQKIVAARAATAVLASPTLRAVPEALPRPGAYVPLVDPDTALALEAKRQQIRALEEAQRKAIEAARQQLEQAQFTLTPMHPQVVALQQRLEAVSQPPPELAQLRADERSLMAQIAPPRPVAVNPSPALDPSASAAQPPSPAPVSPERDGALQLAQSRLALAIRSYEDTMGRIEKVKEDLDVVRAIYRSRYQVVTPPEVPKKPKKATAQNIGIGAVIGGALLALLLAAGLELLGGNIVEPWQVRRRLKLEVLGEFEQRG
jgi:uncharacterized protein involved in exopolysaccharide biosynthesis